MIDETDDDDDDSTYNNGSDNGHDDDDDDADDNVPVPAAKQIEPGGNIVPPDANEPPVLANQPEEEAGHHEAAPPVPDENPGHNVPAANLDDQGEVNNIENVSYNESAHEEEGNADDNDAAYNNPGIDTVPIPANLPTQAQREMQRLANEGQVPVVYAGRTRGQHNRQHVHATMASPPPIKPQEMTPYEKALFRRRTAGVGPPSHTRNNETTTLMHTVFDPIHTQEGLASVWVTRSGGRLQRTQATPYTKGRRATQGGKPITATEKPGPRVPHVPEAKANGRD